MLHSRRQRVPHRASPAGVVPLENHWINPDCGLKTRGWSETEAALSNMVAAAKLLRKELAAA